MPPHAANAERDFILYLLCLRLSLGAAQVTFPALVKF